MNEPKFQSITKKFDSLENYLLICPSDADKEKQAMKHRFSHFKSEFKKKWTKSRRIVEKFLTTNGSWLEGTFEISIKTHCRRGRPSKSFSESSERTKHRKTDNLLHCK